MRQNIHKTVLGLLKSKVLLTISAGFMLSSCVIYTGGYSETDGVYYDPNRDTLPQAYGYEGNAVGDYYDYGYQRDGVIEQSKRNERERQNRYRNGNWNNDNTTNSDWGVYTGSEVNYYDYGWGSGFWGYPWGMGFNYGWGNPWWSLGYSSRFGWGMSLGYAWGSPWGWYDPFWGFYGSRWGMYNPYWGWGGYYGTGYWGYGNGYWGSRYSVPRRLSGADGSYHNNSVGARNSTAQGSLRTGNTYRNPGLQQSTGANNRVGNQRIGTSSSSTNSTMRNNTYQNNNRVYQQSSPSYGSPSMRSSSSSGGMRSGGGFSGSSSSGGMRTSGGGMRTR